MAAGRCRGSRQARRAHSRVFYGGCTLGLYGFGDGGNSLGRAPRVRRAIAAEWAGLIWNSGIAISCQERVLSGLVEMFSGDHQASRLAPGQGARSCGTRQWIVAVRTAQGLCALNSRTHPVRGPRSFDR